MEGLKKDEHPGLGLPDSPSNRAGYARPVPSLPSPLSPPFIEVVLYLPVTGYSILMEVLFRTGRNWKAVSHHDGRRCLNSGWETEPGFRSVLHSVLRGF